MNHDVFDVLIFLFEDILEDEQELPPDYQSVANELEEAGFERWVIERAFVWLEGLADMTQKPDMDWQSSQKSIRVYTDQECAVISTECRGFLHYLEQSSIVSPKVREMIIERILALDSVDLDLDKLKWVSLMVLLNIPGEEAALARMESLVSPEPRHMV